MAMATPLLDLQRKSQQIGRIRTGIRVETGEKYDDGTPKTRPKKIDTFRFTTASKPTVAAVAVLYGGTVRPWEGQRGQFEVITDRDEIDVIVPPRDAVISQAYEMWNKGGCLHRCDSQWDRKLKAPCVCPHAKDPNDAEAVEKAAKDRAALAKKGKACALITRINVMIPDLPGWGVFRADTHSYYAATEAGDKADLMEIGRAQNIFLPAKLRIEQRVKIDGGRTDTYPVLVLEIANTFREIASGALASGGIMAQLPAAPGEQQRAIGAGGRPAAPPARQGKPPASAPAAATPPAAPAAPAGEENGPVPDDEDAREARAQEIADQALTVPIDQLREMCSETARHLKDIYVCTSRDGDVWEELTPWLRDVWAERNKPAEPGEPGEPAPAAATASAPPPAKDDGPVEDGLWALDQAG